jgi:hypothetical protein
MKAVNRACDRSRPDRSGSAPDGVVLVVVSGTGRGMFVLIVFGGLEGGRRQADSEARLRLTWTLVRFSPSPSCCFLALVCYGANIEQRAGSGHARVDRRRRRCWPLRAVRALYERGLYGSLAGGSCSCSGSTSAFASSSGARLNSELDPMTDTRAAGGKTRGLVIAGPAVARRARSP